MTTFNSIYGIDDATALGRKYKRLMGTVFAERTVSRSALAKKLESSSASAFKLTEALARQGVLVESKVSDNNRGRSPAALGLDGSRCYAAGAFYDTDAIRLAVIDAAGNALAHETLEDVTRDTAERIALGATALETLLKKLDVPRERLAGVGISLPGILNPASGRVKRSVVFRKEYDIDLTGPFQERLGAPCRLYAVAPLMVVMEKMSGAARDLRSFLYLPDSGEGLGMFLDGRVYNGHQGFGGEIGFLRIDAGGPVGLDGRRGLLNSVRPLSSVNREIQAVVERGAQSRVNLLWDREKEPILLQKTVIRAATEGDLLCREFIRRSFEELADVVVGLIYAFNPEAVFFAPWTAGLADITIDTVRDRAKLCRIVNDEWQVEILAAKNGRDAVAAGAAFQSMLRFFEVERYL